MVKTVFTKIFIKPFFGTHFFSSIKLSAVQLIKTEFSVTSTCRLNIFHCEPHVSTAVFFHAVRFPFPRSVSPHTLRLAFTLFFLKTEMKHVPALCWFCIIFQLFSLARNDSQTCQGYSYVTPLHRVENKLLQHNNGNAVHRTFPVHVRSSYVMKITTKNPNITSCGVAIITIIMRRSFPATNQNHTKTCSILLLRSMRSDYLNY